MNWPKRSIALPRANAVSVAAKRRMQPDPPTPSIGPKSNELAIRVVSGATMIAVAAVALYLGGFAFWLLIMAVALAMQFEWAALVGRTDKQRLSMLALMVPLSMLSPWASGPSFLALGLIFGAALFVSVAERGFRLSAGLLYIGFPVLALLYLRQQDNGLLLAIWAMAIVWMTDIGAYFAGRMIGGPRIAPSISPSKTWAGLGGGVVAALIFGLILHHSFGLPQILAIASGFLAVLAQAGDFFESWLKRRAGVKDSGNLIPGHGGVLDRLDGQVPVAPAAALLVAAMSYWTLV